MIRKFTKSDMDQIIKIWLETSVHAHDFIGKDFWESKVGDMRDIYIPSSETYVYEEAKVIKGFISLFDNTIAALFVLPEYQGNGVGKKLILKAKSIRKNIELAVYKENKRSIDFYIKNGFKVIKEQKDSHTGHKELIMVFNHCPE